MYMDLRHEKSLQFKNLAELTNHMIGTGDYNYAKRKKKSNNLYKPERLVMALETARAVQTPFLPPDISSPSRSLANRSFINSTSATT